MERIRSIWLPVNKEPIVKEFNSTHEEFEAGTNFIEEYEKTQFTDHISIQYNTSMISDKIPEKNCSLIIRFDDCGKLNGNTPNRRITLKSMTQSFDDIINGNIVVSKMESGAEDCCDFYDEEIQFFKEMFSLKYKDFVPEKYHNLRSKENDILTKLWLENMFK